jgi:alanine racemase
MAVIKANAYGHGLASVARILDAADAFAVARLDEAIQLRESGVARKIVVLGGFISCAEAQLAERYGLDVVVHCREQIDMLCGQAPGALGIWLKIDTGMGRLGIEPQVTSAAIASLAPRASSLRLMTHLASADLCDEPTTSEQLDRFGHAIGHWHGDVSIANSAAILRWPDTMRCSSRLEYAGENWVRPGLMLYGISPLPGESPQSVGLVPVMSFETRLIAVRQLARGARVGYGGDWRAERDSVIGVAAAGYADGYPWHVARGTPALVGGRIVPVVGRVSMDMITVDLTGIPPPQLGDRVVLWGDAPPLAEIARQAGTIPYELLAGMSPRVVRQVEG